MTKLLVVLSKDPYTTEIPDLALSIGLDAQAKGNDVSFYLIEDGVTAARNGGFAEKIVDAQSQGLQFFADDKSVFHRGLKNKLVDGVQVKEIGTLLDYIVDEYDKVTWF